MGVFYPFEDGGSSGNLCTGSMISPTVILTAAHCVYNSSDGTDARNNPRLLKVYAGASLKVPSEIYTLPALIDLKVHPKWTGSVGGSSVDLALLELAYAVDYGETYRIRKSDFQNGTKGTIVGYGLDAVPHQGNAANPDGDADIDSDADTDADSDADSDALGDTDDADDERSSGGGGCSFSSSGRGKQVFLTFWPLLLEMLK